MKIYTLEHPKTNEIRYVGITAGTLKHRLAQHLCDERINKRTSWIKSLNKKGLIPKIKLLDNVDNDIWQDEEKFYISYFKYLGLRLTNMTEGGDRVEMTKEIRNKISNSNFIEYKSGEKINGIVFLKEIRRQENEKERKGLFVCPYCNNEFVTNISSIKNGVTKSCGCYRRIIARNSLLIHGLRNHKLYRTWQNIKKRCDNPKSPDYKDNGKLGIKMYYQWSNDFKKFHDWCMLNGYSEFLKLGRIDKNKDYSPSNCKFMTNAECCRNRNNAKLTNFDVEKIRELKNKDNSITQKKLGLMFGIAQAGISDIINFKTWKL